MNLKSGLAICSILALIYLVFFGDLYQEEPSVVSITVFLAGAAAFSILFILRLVSFIRWMFSDTKR